MFEPAGRDSCASEPDRKAERAMNNSSLFTAALLFSFAAFVGCTQTVPTAEEPTPAATADEASTVEMTDAEIDALAETQKVCAVTGEPLGSMGKPVPVKVTDSAGKDHTVLLCCESCREELLENPDEHLAKLDQASGQAAE